MKKRTIRAFVLFMSIPAAVFLFGCGGKDTPRSVAEKFLEALSTQDYETAKKYGTEETQKLLEMMNGFNKMSTDSSAAKDFKFEITREKVDGQNATIFYKEEGKEGELQLPMVEIDGKWKVLLSKESINNAEGANAMEVGATNTDSIK
jgi:hypothetical protein